MGGQVCLLTRMLEWDRRALMVDDPDPPITSEEMLRAARKEAQSVGESRVSEDESDADQPARPDVMEAADQSNEDDPLEQSPRLLTPSTRNQDVPDTRDEGERLIPEDSDDTSPPTSPQGGLVDKLWPKRSRWGKVGVTVAFVFAALWLVGVFVGDQDEEAIASHNDGITLVEEGRWEDAVAAFTEAIELEPEDTDLLASAYRNRSVALGELGRIEEAVTDASAAIDLQPVDTDILAQAYVNRSVAVAQLGRFEEAVTDTTAAIDLQPADTDILAQAYVNRSVAVAQLGRFEEAISDATAAIDLQPANTDVLGRALFVRGLLLDQVGRTEEGIADLNTALRLLPPTHELHQAATEILAEMESRG